jgi:glycosyltransferase involved in cell wall biosynthesis
MKEEIKPLVSVIICFLNEEKFLEEAIISVVNQQYSKWQLILIDDGSQDNSWSISKKYVERFPEKVIYSTHINNANKGLSASRNFGISMASGSLIAILDADDVWLPQKLEEQVAIMMANVQVAMICEASEYWYSWHDNSKPDVIIQVGSKQDKLFTPPELVEMLYPLSNSPAPCPSGIMIRKDVVNKHGGFEEHFIGKYQLYEDQAFLHKIYLNEYIYISSLCNNRYRQRDGSLVQKIKQEGNYHVVRRYFLEWLEQYINQNNFQYKSVRKLLNRALLPYHKPITYFFNSSYFSVLRWFKN